MARTNPRMLWQLPLASPSAPAATSKNRPLPQRGAGRDAGYLNSERYWLDGFHRSTNARWCSTTFLNQPPSAAMYLSSHSLGRLGDAVDVALIDADELDALALELLERIDVHDVDVHPRLDASTILAAASICVLVLASKPSHSALSKMHSSTAPG